MALSAAARIQDNSGTVTTAGTSFTPTLPNPTTPGSTLLLFVSNPGTSSLIPQTQGYDPPWVADLTGGGNLWAWRRDDNAGGETSWALTGTASAKWSWYIQEWSGLSTIAVPDAVSNTAGTPSVGTVSNAQVINLSAAGSVCSPDVSDFLALVFYRASGSTTGSSIWPAAHTYSSGWSEDASVPVGDGTVNSDFLLMVAESFPGVSGSLDCSMTWDTTGGGAYTNKTVEVGMTCYRPSVPAPPAGVLTA